MVVLLGEVGRQLVAFLARNGCGPLKDSFPGRLMDLGLACRRRLRLGLLPLQALNVMDAASAVTSSSEAFRRLWTAARMLLSSSLGKWMVIACYLLCFSA
jgi:hypothetical protein